MNKKHILLLQVILLSAICLCLPNNIYAKERASALIITPTVFKKISAESYYPGIGIGAGIHIQLNRNFCLGTSFHYSYVTPKEDWSALSGTVIIFRTYYPKEHSVEWTILKLKLEKIPKKVGFFCHLGAGIGMDICTFNERQEKQCKEDFDGDLRTYREKYIPATGALGINFRPPGYNNVFNCFIAYKWKVPSLQIRDHSLSLNIGLNFWRDTE